MATWLTDTLGVYLEVDAPTFVARPPFTPKPLGSDISAGGIKKGYKTVSTIHL